MRTSAAAAVAVLALAGAACGRGDAQVTAQPAKVDASLAPAALAGSDLQLYAKTDQDTIDAFANASKGALQADARLWELRQSERLVGALQITTVLPDLHLDEPRDRNALLRQIMPDTVNRLVVHQTPVWVTASNDKVVYVWFGRQMFEVLQLKGSKLVPEAVITELIAYQRTQKAWHPLPAESYDEDRNR